MSEKQEKGARKVVLGIVVANAANKTIRVRMDRRFMHPVYKKVVTRKKVFTAHDEENKCKAGDKVQITQCRPLSRNKRWRLTQIVEKAV